jgi:hypothetical protein
MVFYRSNHPTLSFALLLNDPALFNIIRFEVDHDRLYLDALDRDLKREKLGMVHISATKRMEDQYRFAPH